MCRGCCRALSAAAARLRAAGVRGGAPRGGGWARRPKRYERARTQATGDRRPRPITVYAGRLRGRRAPPPDDKQGRRASQTSQNFRFATGSRPRRAGTAQAGLSWASAQLRQTQILRDASFAARPRAGERLRLQRAAGVYRCARAYRAGHKGTGRAVGRRRRTSRAAGPGSVSLGGDRRRAADGQAASKYRTCQA